MKIDLSSEPPQIVVFLSKRNLRALLRKLSLPDQAPMLATRNIWLDDELAPSALALVVADDDDEHYRFREPGELHPNTIEWLRLNGVRLGDSDGGNCQNDEADP